MISVTHLCIHYVCMYVYDKILPLIIQIYIYVYTYRHYSYYVQDMIVPKLKCVNEAELISHYDEMPLCNYIYCTGCPKKNGNKDFLAKICVLEP